MAEQLGSVVTAVFCSQLHNAIKKKSLANDAAAKPHGCCRPVEPGLLFQVVYSLRMRVCTIVYARASLLPAHPNKASQDSSKSGITYKWSENTLLHMESFLPIGVSLFPKTALLSL